MLFVRRAGRAAERFLCSGGFLHGAGMNQLVAVCLHCPRVSFLGSRLAGVCSVGICSPCCVFKGDSVPEVFS